MAWELILLTSMAAKWMGLSKFKETQFKPIASTTMIPNCVQGMMGGQPDVMGYHDAREIPNYWTYAQNFVLHDHMFEPTSFVESPGASFYGFGMVGEMHQSRSDELHQRNR